MNNELGMYVHIPFCKSKCYYCDFISYANKYEQIEEYVNSIIKEINWYDLSKYNVTTIYIGGGTPSFIDSTHIVQILNCIRNKIETNRTKFEDIEITIELNPGTVTEEKLNDYKLAGVHRLSIGLQSTHDRLLKEIGRIHNFEEFLNTYNLAKEVGFDNINIDLMLGLPHQSIEDLKESLEAVIKLNPNHISVYSLIVEDGTQIAEMIDNGVLELPDEDVERNMYWYVKNTLELNGYNHYEISNFAKKGKESKHNLNCWEQKEYIGIGVAAHSYINGVRYSNVESIEKYVANVNLNESKNEIKKGNKEADSIKMNRIIQEEQNEKDKQKEYMMLGLRKIEGVHISKFKEKFTQNPIYLFRKKLEKLVNEELIIIDGDWIKLTNKGLDLANQVWEEFV